MFHSLLLFLNTLYPPTPRTLDTRVLYANYLITSPTHGFTQHARYSHSFPSVSPLLSDEIRDRRRAII